MHGDNLRMTEPAVPAEPDGEPVDALARLRAAVQTSPGSAPAHMSLGAALHQAGDPIAALASFEAALQAEPASADAASACAAVLTELGRPQAAHRVLAGVKDSLWNDANGCVNLAITAETCGLNDEARTAYDRALALEPDNIRALNNLALLSLRHGDDGTAIALARRCLALMPDEPVLWVNLADLYTGARRYADALAHVEAGLQRFAGLLELLVRRAVLLAFHGELAAAQHMLDRLGPQARGLLAACLEGTPFAPADAASGLPGARELYLRQTVQALELCDWRSDALLLRTVTALLDEPAGRCDWRALQAPLLALPLTEDQQITVRVRACATHAALAAPLRAFSLPARQGDGRIHVGFTVQSLRDEAATARLEAQLGLHDRSRFALHVYSPTPQPEARLSQRLRGMADSVVEIAHMTLVEATQRIRLNHLDLLIDHAQHTPWSRDAIYAARAAPVQLQQQSGLRTHIAQSPFDYTVGDFFTHPGPQATGADAPLVRLAHTCWFAGPAPASDGSMQTRTDAGLPEGALVLCAFLPPALLDAHTFGTWMQLLRQLPDAVLWLPGYAAAARANLHREAEAAGVAAQRLVFVNAAGRAQWLAQLPLADLFIDALRVNAVNGLVDALRAGIPAVTCAGQSMASRLGGSALLATGVPGQVVESEAAYADAVLALGRNRTLREQLRRQLADTASTAPLFDLKAHVQEWEVVWTRMAERARAGLPPAGFDLPLA